MKLSVITIFTAIILMSCNKSNNINENSNLQSFTCKINGETFTADTFNNTLIGDETFKRLDIRAIDKSGKQIIVTVNDVDPLDSNFSHLGDTVYVYPFLNSPVNLASLGTIVDPDGSFLITMPESKESGYSKLTDCDFSNKKVSGIFEFMVKDYQTDEITYVTEGKYSNLTYYK
ncbi:MAG: hypothetical protein ABFR62_12790 [Bacteroidota bacterium]